MHFLSIESFCSFQSFLNFGGPSTEFLVNWFLIKTKHILEKFLD